MLITLRSCAWPLKKSDKYSSHNLIGLPLDHWNCINSVRMWLRNFNKDDNLKVKKHPTSEHNYDDNRISIWKYLQKFSIKFSKWSNPF